MLAADGDGHGDIDQTVLALVNIVTLSFLQPAGKDSITLPATTRRCGVDPVETGADILPTGGCKDIPFKIEYGGHRPGNRSEAFTELTQFADIDKFGKFHSPLLHNDLLISSPDLFHQPHLPSHSL